MKRKDFASVGSVVRTKSGGAYMIVVDRQSSESGSIICTCRWIDRKGEQCGKFLEESLEDG